MYCPNCGADTTIGLKYCKRCGINLAAPQPVSGSGISSGGMKRPTGAAWAVALATVAVCLGGLGIVFTNASEIIHTYPGQSIVGDPNKLATLMVVFGSATVFGVIFLMLRLFTRLMLGPQDVHRESLLKRAVSRGEPAPLLQEPPAVVSSVTEHTTRNFEHPAYRDQRARE
jgi:hypothetical protein